MHNEYQYKSDFEKFCKTGKLSKLKKLIKLNREYKFNIDYAIDLSIKHNRLNIFTFLIEKFPEIYNL